MTELTQVVVGAASAALLWAVLELVRRRKLTEEYSILWLACATALLMCSLWPEALHLSARVLGIHYPPAALMLVLVFFVFAVSLAFSVVVSRQRQQIEQLVEEIALLEADIRELRSRVRAIESEEVIPGPARDRDEARDQRRVG